MRLDKILIWAVLIISVSPVAADRLVIPGHYQSPSLLMPTRGSSMQRVLSEFGEPINRIGPVGEPPITEWDYGDFRVYFEYSTVLHSVDLTTLIMPQK